MLVGTVSGPLSHPAVLLWKLSVTGGVIQVVVAEQAMLGAFLIHLRHSILKLGGFAQDRCRGSLGCVRLMPRTLDSLTDLGYLSGDPMIQVAIRPCAQEQTQWLWFSAGVHPLGQSRLLLDELLRAPNRLPAWPPCLPSSGPRLPTLTYSMRTRRLGSLSR
jgi:hypothetical protein